MLDVHCHILPGLDDGARNLEDSLAMARVLVDAGFDAVAPSPHVGEGPGGDVQAADAQAARTALAAGLEQEGIALGVLPNAEHHLTPAMLERAGANEVTPLGGQGRWLLVELPWAPPPDPEDALFRLQAKGFKILLAHPERHDYVDLAMVRRLVERGFRMQLEVGSFVQVFGRGAKMRALDMADAGLGHVLATDMHQAEEARAWLPAGLRAVADHYGRRAVVLATGDKPTAMVEDATVDDVVPFTVAR